MFGILHTIFFLLFFNRSHPQARSTLRRLALVSRSVFNIIYRKGTEHKKMKKIKHIIMLYIYLLKKEVDYSRSLARLALKSTN